MEIIKKTGSITDKTLVKSLTKDGYHLTDGLFNKEQLLCMLSTQNLTLVFLLTCNDTPA